MSLLPSGLAGSSSQEEGASLTWTGGNTTGEGERERHFYERVHSIYICYMSSLDPLDDYTQFYTQQKLHNMHVIHVSDQYAAFTTYVTNTVHSLLKVTR